MLSWKDYNHARIPSYTDRVLTCSGPGFGMRRVDQGAMLELSKISDHVPVYASFEVDIFAPTSQAQGEVLRDWKIDVSGLTVTLEWSRLHEKGHGGSQAASAWAQRYMGSDCAGLTSRWLSVHLVNEYQDRYAVNNGVTHINL